MSGIRLGCPQVTIYRPKQTVTLTYAALIVKRVEIGCAARVLVHARCVLLRPAWPTKQPPSLTKASEREAARQTRSSVPCCQPPCFRQGGIINIPDCLSTARRNFRPEPPGVISRTDMGGVRLLGLIALRQFVKRLDFQQAPLVRVRPKLYFLQLPFALRAHRKSF